MAFPMEGVVSLAHTDEFARRSHRNHTHFSLLLTPRFAIPRQSGFPWVSHTAGLLYRSDGVISNCTRLFRLASGSVRTVFSSSFEIYASFESLSCFDCVTSTASGCGAKLPCVRFGEIGRRIRLDRRATGGTSIRRDGPDANVRFRTNS